MKPQVVLRLTLVGLSPSHSKCHGVVELHIRKNVDTYIGWIGLYRYHRVIGTPLLYSWP
jgi:hypothetical protein